MRKGQFQKWYEVEVCTCCGGVVTYRNWSTENKKWSWLWWNVTNGHCNTCGEKQDPGRDQRQKVSAAWMWTGSWLLPWTWDYGYWVLREDYLAGEEVQRELHVVRGGGRSGER